MRSMTLVLALAAVCAASPALSQARILTVQDEPRPKPPAVTQDNAPPPLALAQHDAAPVLTPPPHLGPPPATIPVPPQRVPNIEGAPRLAPPPEPPQQAQVPPPSMSAHPKTQERAESTSPPLPPALGRYSFNRVDDGFLRLDKATGHIAYCSPHTAGWGCQAVPENRIALEKEVARLREQVASLKKLQDDVASLKKLRDEVASLRELQDEVASLKDLKDEVAALQKEISTLRPPPPPRPPAPVPPPAAKPDKDSTSKQPSGQDLAGTRAYITYTWRRLVDMINQLQKDMMGRREKESANGLSRT